METFSALLAVCARNSTVTSEFPVQRPVARSFDILFDLRLNRRLSKPSWGWWFESPSGPLWRHCNGAACLDPYKFIICRACIIPDFYIFHIVCSEAEYTFFPIFDEVYKLYLLRKGTPELMKSTIIIIYICLKWYSLIHDYILVMEIFN